VPSGVVRLISDKGQVMQASLPNSGAGTVTYRTTPSLAAYIRAKVRQLRPDGKVTATGGPGPAARLDGRHHQSDLSRPQLATGKPARATPARPVARRLCPVQESLHAG
jgi:hypothetical protein